MNARDRGGAGSTSDLRDLLGTLRRRRWIVVVCAVIATAAAVFVSLRQVPQYQSSATVQVNPLDPNAFLNGYTSYGFLSSMQNEVTVASSPQVATRAASIVQSEGGDPNETGSLSVESPTDTTALVFTYTDPTPSLAQQWANAYANAYKEDRSERAQNAYDATVAGIDAEIATLTTALEQQQKELRTAPASQIPTIQTTINGLLNQISNLNARKALVPVPYETATELIAPAALPASPSSPNPIRDGVLGLILGLGLGIGIAFLRERLDDKMFGKRDLEMEIGAPVLGTVPQVEGWRKRSSVQLVVRDAPKSPSAEAYRMIRTNLQFAAQTEGVRVIAVTSASLGEGKTTTTANLAISLVQADMRVVVVSADLRKPRIHEFFGIENVTGLSDLLEERVGLRTVTKHAGYDKLIVIPSGPVPPHPAELLASARMGKLLEYLRGAADFVLIDTPPLLAVSDTLPVSRMVDGVLIVADAGTTTRSALSHVREQLEQVGARIIGGIYNNFDTSQGTGYGGYYGYRGYGDQKATEAHPYEPQSQGYPEEPQNIWH